ncbi:cyclase family protein [Rhodopseudomonas pseudopalustris]|uniref:Putative cyclase n=1 Tax=Rhodopseudomonas pseudopalustris TaxID=1513892 RepID=A0A1H8WEE6_9BRAD|nr:cyclase family protein [Rhodopseudomonas pseudopalustris]SEP25883.1 Putative cyclase [Rhodopseudomonas pseudopalustris]
MLKALTLGCSIAVVTALAPAMAQDWTKSKWGPDDEIGAANYLTPELALKAAQLVKTGKVYALGIPVDTKTPAYPPRGFKITVVQPGQAGSPGMGPSKTTYNDDIIEGWVGVGSQIDGLGHIGVEHVYYNGNKIADFGDPTGLKKLGIDKLPPMVTRGVLLDMAAHFGTDIVKEGTAFNVKEIEEVAKKQGVEIRQGDVVLFHTGWLGLIGKDDKRYNSGEPGVGVEGAKYLTSKGVVAVGADTWGVEVIPFESKNIFEVHQILLPMNGTYILENMNTADLAKDKVYEFMFVLGQPRFKGAVQSMINPVAIR